MVEAPNGDGATGEMVKATGGDGAAGVMVEAPSGDGAAGGWSKCPPNDDGAARGGFVEAQGDRRRGGGRKAQRQRRVEMVCYRLFYQIIRLKLVAFRYMFALYS